MQKRLAMLTMRMVAILMRLAHGANLLLLHHLATQLKMLKNFHLLFSLVIISHKMNKSLKKKDLRMMDLGDYLVIDTVVNMVVNMRVNMEVNMEVNMVTNHAKE